jgi:ketosteroid isomerase-like protein
MIELAERLNAAMNAHDIDAFVAFFAPDYDSQQPAHPHRAFVGNEQVRKNWSEIFAGVPDFRSELVSAANQGDTLWTEWRWQGTGLDIAGVVVFGLRDGLFAWARLYIEFVEKDGAGIEAAVKDISGR